MRALASPMAVALVFSLCACAPLAAFRPASGLMGDRTFEVGAGGALQSPRPYVDEPMAAAGQVWATTRATRRITVSGVAAFDAEGFALGLAPRFDLLRTDRFAAGLEPQLGFAWGALSVPLAVRILDETWIYTSPRVGTVGLDPALHVPVGLSARFYEGFMLRLEYAVLWTGELSYYQQRRIVGIALAVQR